MHHMKASHHSFLWEIKIRHLKPYNIDNQWTSSRYTYDGTSFAKIITRKLSSTCSANHFISYLILHFILDLYDQYVIWWSGILICTCWVGLFHVEWLKEPLHGSIVSHYRAISLSSIQNFVKVHESLSDHPLLFFI
jgi:hypothetical protein